MPTLTQARRSTSTTGKKVRSSKKMIRGKSIHSIDQTRIFQPTGHSPRVAMQAGWHTVHRLHGVKEGKPHFLPLNDMKIHRQRLDKVEIDQSAVGKLRRELEQMGIRHATIYGDLHMVCVSIAREFGIK
jgi:hypothetical protein